MHNGWRKTFLKAKNVQILQTCFCMRDRSLFKLYSNVKAWDFVVNCFSQFIGRGFTNHSKSWIYLPNNIVNYHFSLRKYCCFKSVIGNQNSLESTPAIVLFSRRYKKGKIFHQKSLMTQYTLIFHSEAT